MFEDTATMMLVILEFLKAVLLPATILIVALIANRTIKLHLTGVFRHKRQNL